MTEKKVPYLLLTAKKKEEQKELPKGSLLEAGLHSSMQKNQELRQEMERLEKNMQDAVHLIGILDAKIAMLSTLINPGYGRNDHSKITYKN